MIHKSEHFSAIANLGQRIEDLTNGSRVFVITDENVESACLPALIENCECLQEADIITIPAGEDSKCFEILEGILTTLLENEADRQCYLVNIGGGVICDLGGFAASIYKRGVRHIQVPTSLMAMCDAAIGGKTGINLSRVKNAIGTFHAPSAVLILPDFLITLPHEEVLSGFAEMLKHGLIADADLWDKLKTSDPEKIKPLIQKSTEIKESIVESDLLEKAGRKLLNFGHSIGHAIESLHLQKGHPLSHGHAIALGMLVETGLSVKKCNLPLSSFDEIATRIKEFFQIPSFTTSDVDEIIAYLQNDKKNQDAEFRFSLIERIGKGVYDISVSETEVRRAIEFSIG